MSPVDAVFAGVELGGTKSIAVLGHGGTIIERVVMPTESPDRTLPALRQVLDGWATSHRPLALGIASFGPIGLIAGTPDYGRMLSTPKPGWANAEILGALAPAIDGPTAIHTDVTGAAFAESRWGAGRGCSDLIYITLGTGVGMGIITGGRAVTGLMHPETGHMRVPRMAGDDFAGSCPFHGDCLEGLASGPAVAARAGRPGDEIADDDALWVPVADAIAEAVAVLFLTLATQRIVFGGGLTLGRPQLLPMIAAGVVAKLGGYLPFVDETVIEQRLVLAGLGADAGPLGALALAETAIPAERAG